MWLEIDGLSCRYAQHGVMNAALYASCLNVEECKAERSRDAQSDSVMHLSRLTGLAICSSSLRPTCHTKHQLFASCGPSRQQAVQAGVLVYLSTHHPAAEAKTGADDDS